MSRTKNENKTIVQITDEIRMVIDLPNFIIQVKTNKETWNDAGYFGDPYKALKKAVNIVLPDSNVVDIEQYIHRLETIYEGLKSVAVVVENQVEDKPTECR